jgi:hypothetical protein
MNGLEIRNGFSGPKILPSQMFVWTTAYQYQYQYDIFYGGYIW